MRLKILFVIVALAAKLSPAVAQTDSVCAANPIGNYHVNGSVGSTFTWNTQGNGAILLGQGSDNVKVQWTSVPGTYNITVKEKNTNGCEGILQTLTIVVYQLSSTVNAQVCKGENYILPNGTMVSDSGSYQIAYTSANGCDSIVTTNLSYHPNPEALFEQPPSVSLFNSSVAPVDLSQSNIVSWDWNFGDGSFYNLQNPTHYYNNVGQYPVTLTVTDNFGCKDTYEQNILVTPFYIPNAFSPNDDGINDTFFDCGYIFDVQSYNLTIWNRWGENIFETNNISKTWDGKTKDGSQCPLGVYVYKIKVLTKGNKSYSYAGSVCLVR